MHFEGKKDAIGLLCLSHQPGEYLLGRLDLFPGFWGDLPAGQKRGEPLHQRGMGVREVDHLAAGELQRPVVGAGVRIEVAGSFGPFGFGRRRDEMLDENAEFVGVDLAVLQHLDELVDIVLEIVEIDQGVARSGGDAVDIGDHVRIAQQFGYQHHVA